MVAVQLSLMWQQALMCLSRHKVKKVIRDVHWLDELHDNSLVFQKKKAYDIIVHLIFF